MKNRILKFVLGTIIGCFFVFNMLFSYNADKSAITMSSLIGTNTSTANAEDFDRCYWSEYPSGNGGSFYFCGYESNSLHCVCGSFC